MAPRVSEVVCRRDAQRHLAGEAVEHLAAAARCLAQLAEIDDALLVEVEALARLIADESRRLFARATATRGVRWLAEIDLAIRLTLRRHRYAVRHPSLDALAGTA